MSSASGSTAWTYISEAAEAHEQPSVQDLRAALERGTDDVKLDILRRVITGTLNGNAYVSWADMRLHVLSIEPSGYVCSLHRSIKLTFDH